jgi:ketosteroid isomerase-like protein
MKASPPTQAAVRATLQQWKDAYSQQDVDGVLAVIAPDDDVVGIGTGPDEWRVGPEEFKAQLERDFAQSEALSVDYEPLVVSEAGPVVWVAGRATVQARVEGQGLTLTGRSPPSWSSERAVGCWCRPTSRSRQPNRPRADPSNLAHGRESDSQPRKDPTGGR